VSYCEAGQKLIEIHLEAERQKAILLGKQHLEKGKRAVSAFERIMGVMHTECYTDWYVTGHEPVVILADDLKIKHVRCDGDDWFHLRGNCLRCGESAWSKACWNAATLGGQLVKFEPDIDHVKNCPAKTKPLPWRERLRLAWRILKEGR
jgi:hypothetical protein